MRFAGWRQGFLSNITNPKVRRVLDTATGTVLLGFSARLATERF